MAIDTETMQLIERIVARSVANATSLKGAAGEIAKGVTQYVGARYVPLFAEPLEWDKTKAYEPLTIVLYQGNSYTSRQYVPVGVELTNESFWAVTGNYNAQVEQYRQEVKSFDGRITANSNAIVKETEDRTAAVTAEKTRAEAAEQTLQANIDAEKTRAEGAEQTLQANIDAEKTRAEGAEQTLQANIDELTAKTDMWFDTVADLKAADNLSYGMTVHTNGYYSVNDGGAGFYLVSNTNEDNLGVELNKKLYANLIHHPNIYNVCKYGFTPNNEFTGVKFTDFASKVKYGSTLYFPQGVYNINGNISLPEKRLNILGDAINLADQDKTIGTVLSFTGLSANSTCLTLGKPNGFIRNIKISANAFEMTEDRSNIGENVDVFTDKATIENVSGLRLPSNSYGYEIDNVEVVRASSWAIIGSFYNIMNNVSIYQCLNGIICYNDCVLTNLRIVNVERAINLAGALTIVNNVRCDSIKGDAIYISSNGCIVSNVNVDYAQGVAVRINSASNVKLSNITGRTGTKSPANKASVVTDCSTNTNKNGALIRIEGGSSSSNVSIDSIFKQSNPLDTPSDLLVPKNFVIITGDGAHSVFIKQGSKTEFFTDPTKENIKAIVNTIDNSNASFSGIVLDNFVTGKNNSFKTATLVNLQ